MASEEKRAHERAAVDLPVHIRSASGAEFEGTVENLGVLGALVSTPDLEVRLDVGDEVMLTIKRAEGDVLEVEGEVLRLEQEFAGGDIRRAFAVRFPRPVG